MQLVFESGSVQLSFVSALLDTITWTVYVCPASVDGTRALPDWPNDIVPEKVRVMHCPGAITSWLLLSLLPSSAFTRVICPDVQLAVEVDEVVVAVVVVEVEDDDVVVVDEEDVVDPEVTLGTKTTSFRLSQPCWYPESPRLSCCELVVVTQPCAVKLPRRPIATSRTGEFPVLLIWIVIVLIFPETESATRLAVTCPRARLISFWSWSVNWCVYPTSCSWSVISDCGLIIPMDEGIIWYPVGVLTMVGLRSRRTAFVP